MLNSKRPIIGFIHCYTVNNWYNILEKQLERIIVSGLWDKLDKIYVGSVGPRKGILSNDKFEWMFHMDDPEIGESLTLAMMHQKSKTFNGSIFYIHSKGVSRNSPPNQVDWRRYMEYFIIEKHEECLSELKNVDLVGVNWHTDKGEEKSNMYGKLVYQPITPHFSGNFFWGNSEYIRYLPRIFPIEGRYDNEFWIGLNNPRVAELWNSGVKHHRNIYPRENYENKMDIKYYKGRQLEILS